MRKDQCLFCTSRTCDYRIYTESFDEIACRKHHKELETHADATIDGIRNHVLGTSKQVRGF